jgi:universal stress protein E
MKSIRRILVALGLTPDGASLTTGSRLALDHALEIAPALGASLVLFHSTASDEAWDPGEGDYVDVLPGETARKRTALDAALARARAASVSSELAVTAEPAAQGIIRRVLRGDVDLVLSGKRNEPVHGLRLGSVATKLLRKCPCPVWVVRPEGEALPTRILAASDLSPVGERVLEAATFVADRCDAELLVVHAFQRPLAIQMEGDEASARFEKVQRSERRQRIEEQLAAAGCRRPVEIHVGLTSPTRAVLACDERIAPDLVVMGTVSRGGVAGLLVGNTAERLLARLDCSLLTVKPEDFVCPLAVDEG